MDHIVVTGFGPFGTQTINDSWNTVKQLKNTDLEEKLGVVLITKEIPVTYDDSLSVVRELWQKHRPALVIHVGVHQDPEGNIQLETKARKNGYTRNDIKSCQPDNGICPLNADEVIRTGIDVEFICSKCEAHPLTTSDNAGLYLCEYTYYISLTNDRSRTLFVHIPPFGSKMPLEKKVEALKQIITSAYCLIRTNNVLSEEKIANVKENTCDEKILLL